MKKAPSQAPTLSASHSLDATQAGSAAPLSGRNLALARALWVVVALTVVALEVLALPGQYAAQVDPNTLRDLHGIGMSPALFASIGLVELAIIGTLNVALALLLFWRGSRDRMALFVALTFLTFGGVAGSSLDDITGGPSPLPNVLALRMTARVLVVIGQVAFIAFWYVFPSGQFVPRWTRWLLVPATAYWVAAAEAVSNGGMLVDVRCPRAFRGVAWRVAIILVGAIGARP